MPTTVPTSAMTRFQHRLSYISFSLAALCAMLAMPALAATTSPPVNPSAEYWTSAVIGNAEAFFALPKGFPPEPSAVLEDESGYQSVYFPPGHREDNWTEKMRLMRMPGQMTGGNGENSAQALLNALAERVKVACPADYFYTPFNTGSPRRAAAYMGCKSNPKRDTFAVYGYYNVLLSMDSSYVLIRERRIPFSAGNVQLGDDVLHRWRKEIDSLTVCRTGVRCMPQPGIYNFLPAPNTAATPTAR